ncbi:MAG: Glu-tRNA(Gln) amidotransferase subunit GatD [Candidatus Nanohaloarchaea archaeon]|nr:Glu-tRNA(Gln) amidotransferase subunit GatD [Candidatus Nanohaloarchaea archaeon]
MALNKIDTLSGWEQQDECVIAIYQQQPDRVQERLDDAGIEIGDTVRVARNGTEYEGRLMPRSEQGDTDTLVLKLDNGYNTGVTVDADTDIELVSGRDAATGETQELPEHDPEKPDIAILHTGGTIASKVSYEKGGVIPAFDPEELFQFYPELFEEANIESEVLGQIHSGDMEPGHWQEFAAAVADHREKDGVIIGHGTDTMQYTAAALSFMLENIDIPVVLVGAQRSSDRPSSDSAINLLSAMEFIKEGRPGVYVCMHAGTSDTDVAIHEGTRVRKMHTSRRDAFRSIDTRPVARVSYPSGDVELLRDRRTAEPGDFALRTELDTDVGLVKSRPGIDLDMLDAVAGKRGVVLEGTGLGHFPVNSFDEHTEHHDEVLDAIRELAEDGLAVMTSQCIHGRVNMNIYEYGVKIQNAGVISAENMLTEVAYVKLMWALGQADSLQEAEELFRQNVAGEIVEREEYDGFD